MQRSTTPHFRSPRLWSLGLAAAACLAVSIDLRVQTLATTTSPPGFVRDYFKATETFGNGFGVAMVLLAVVVLDPFRRVQFGRLVAASLGAGLVADVVKLTVGRTRPHVTDVDGMLAAGAWGWETFRGWMPLADLGSGGQSFPSAHTATAVGLATVLAWLYPAGTRLFYTFAAGVALQRTCIGAHYLSDVLAGAAIGTGWGHACCLAGPIARGFDRLEGWWSRRFGWGLPPEHPATVTLRPALAVEPAEDRRQAA